MQTIYWLAIFVVLLIIEIVTMGLTTIWFAGGALIAFCAGLMGFGTTVQIVVFLAVYCTVGDDETNRGKVF